jgi:uncharacterized protein YndB with AHSA1/START domain
MADGTLSTVDGRPVLRFERRLRHPAQRVWAAITDPAELKHWFPADVRAELRVGAPITFAFDDFDGESPDGEVLEVDEPRVYMFRWGDSVLRFELVPDDDGCRLYFSHTLGGQPPLNDAVSAPRHAAGWDLCLDRLVASLDGTEPEATTHGNAWFAGYVQYLERFGLATGQSIDEPEGFTLRFERDPVKGRDHRRRGAGRRPGPAGGRHGERPRSRLRGRGRGAVAPRVRVAARRPSTGDSTGGTAG